MNVVWSRLSRLHAEFRASDRSWPLPLGEVLMIVASLLVRDS
ncbi:MAG: hypothetical protein V7L27_25945 [Nostoc sp.]